jgi:S-adenosylmethionine:tRNA ribosyltransferase-isomerase
MRLADLDYPLPPELIAQHPLPARDGARLLVLNRGTRKIEHSQFYKLERYLREGDVIVLNDTRVFPARLRARKASGGQVELLMVRPVDEPAGGWLALARSRRPLQPHSELFLNGSVRLRVASCERPGRVIVYAVDSQPMEQILVEHGELALPPYIRRRVGAADADLYQTVYADNPGAIAAPTAGLHFTPELLSQLAAHGIKAVKLTLHIGPGTFAPIRHETVERHAMEAENYVISPATLAALEHARRTGGRIIATGTSTVRALESYAITGRTQDNTSLFILPGFRFKLVEGMITNFHLPRSTVLALVMAFGGRELTLTAYHEAIRRRYRFLSYGDAMLIV